MIHFFRKIRLQYFTGKPPGSASGRFGKYLVYAVGEIVLVVIGILIALQINNWNQGRINKQNELKVYQNIKRQVKDDLNEITKVKGMNDYFSIQFEFAVKIIATNDRNNTDTLSVIAMNLSQFSDFNRTGNIYETLVNSGDIKLLKNSEIPGRLQKLEMIYTYMNKLEDIHWDIIMKELSPELKGVINYATLHAVKPEKLYSVEMQNIIIELIYLSKGKSEIYNGALNEINGIIELIDEEMNK
jgi:hypothetical protein